MNFFRFRAMVLLVAFGLWGCYVPMSRADDEPALKLAARARIATIDPQTNQLKLRTQDDKPLTVLVDRQAKIRINDREIGFADLREGQEVAVVYQAVNGKNVASALTVKSTVETQPPAELPPKGAVAVIRAPKQTKVTGTVVKVMQANNSFLVRLPDGHEDMFYLENTAAAADLEEGAAVTVVYEVRNVVSSVALTSADGTSTRVPRTSEGAAQGGTAAAAGFLTFEGDVVRVAPEEGFVILKSKDGKERKFFTQKNSSFMLDKKKAQLSDLQSGSRASVTFKSVDGRDMISSFSSMPTAPAPAAPAKVRPR